MSPLLRINYNNMGGFMHCFALMTRFLTKLSEANDASVLTMVAVVSANGDS